MSDLYRTIHGSAHDIPLPDGSVQCIVTSPPYWGLRKYAGAQGVEWPAVTYLLNEWVEPVTVDAMTCDLGLEPSPVEYIGHLILCLREWRRVLRDDGVCWVNLGDSYASGGTGGASDKSGLNGGRGVGPNEKIKQGATITRNAPPGLKPKDLYLIPSMFALAARADGWWLRSDVVWAKPNPMPESVTDRPTSAHEHVFLLAKSSRYYYDADAVRRFNPRAHEVGYTGGTKWELANQDDRNDWGNAIHPNPSGSNLKNVWHIATQPTPFAHFATYPEKLVEPCIRAGTSARGCCPECGAPWERVVERKAHAVNEKEGAKQRLRCAGVISGGTDNVTLGLTDQVERTTVGWRPTCECQIALKQSLNMMSSNGGFGGVNRKLIERASELDPVPCTVLDPFHGSGTTGIVALREGRAYVGVDISAEYLDGVTRERIKGGAQIGFGL